MRNVKISTFGGSWSELQAKVYFCRHCWTKYVPEQSKEMKESFTETENLGICFWKVFNFHVLVFRSSFDFLLSRHPKSLIYGNSWSNHKVYFTRYLLEVLCYLCWIKLVLQRFQFRMYYDLSEEFSFVFKVFNDEPNCWEYYFYGLGRKKNVHWLNFKDF